MSETTCQCGKPTGSTATLCIDCRKTMEIAIVNISVYYADLDTLHARLVRFGQGGRSSETPLAIDARFARLGDGSEIEHDARNTIVGWVRYIGEYVSVGNGPTCGPYCLHVSCALIRKSRPPLDAMPSMCAYLLRWADWLRTSPAGIEALDEFCDVERRLRRLIDRPLDRWYAGPCNALTGSDEDAECGETLYALADLGEVTCRKCQATYDVKARREWLLAAAEEYEAPVSVIARAIIVLADNERDEGRLAARLRQWASRNRIFPVRHQMIDGIERPLFRIGTVLDLLAEDARTAEETRQRKLLRLTRAG